ncbi:MAG TPA: 8-amino-7-oxononanoate synthase, partial [Candidatus Binatia bacterium]|nr:8-amino-7-oxononanoate synthase [Candidatus Binatia bacterium]
MRKAPQRFRRLGAPLLAEPLQQIDRTCVLHRGRKLAYFAGCDYYRLASHPDVLRAVHDGLERFGLNVAASRRTTGNHPLYEQLEQELATFFGADAAVLVSNGYVANLA